MGADAMNDDYRQMVPQPAEPVESCPCCGGAATVWDYIENPDSVVQRVVMCDTQDSLGPRDALVYSGCLLAMPPNDFYKSTGRDAVRYWNAYARALSVLRRANEGEA